MSINSFRQFRQDVRIAPRKGLYTKRIAWQSFLAGLTTIATIALFIGHISTVQAQADPRAQMIARAQSWINAHVPYNQGGSYDGYREDCSGFVSYVWLLGSSPDTVGLWEHYSTVLPSINSLLPGDTLNNNTPGNFGHVLIFAQWDNPSHSQFTSYEEVGNHGAISRHLSILEDGTIPGLNAHQPFYPERLNSLFTPGQPTFSSDAHSSLNISMASYQVCASNLGTGTTVYIVMWRDAVPSRGIATPGGWSYSGQSQNGCYNITALTSPGLPLANVVYYSVAALVPINISEAAQKRTACAAATGFARMCDSSSAAGIIPPLQPTVFASDALSTLDIANATYRVCASNLGTGTTVYLVLWRGSISAQGVP